MFLICHILLNVFYILINVYSHYHNNLKLDTKILILWDSFNASKIYLYFPKFQCLAYLAKASISVITNGPSLS